MGDSSRFRYHFRNGAVRKKKIKRMRMNGTVRVGVDVCVGGRGSGASGGD